MHLTGTALLARLLPRALAVAVAVVLLAGLCAVWTRAADEGSVEATSPAVDPADLDAGSGPSATTSTSTPSGSADAPTSPRPSADTTVAEPVPTTRRDSGEGPPAPEPPRPRSVDLGDAPAPVSIEAGVPPGAYLLRVALAASSDRVQLTIGDERAGEFRVNGQQSLEVPVHVRGPADPVGVRSVGGHDESISVDRIDLVPTSAVYTTRGAALIDPGGRAVIQRGVNRPGLNASADPENLGQPDFVAMRDAGVEIVRLKLGQHLWLRDSCHHDASYAAAVDRAVASITELGLVAMLDLAWTTAGDPCGEPGLQVMPDRQSVAFWREVAARYHADPLVAFNIFNEPGDVSRDLWRDGGTITERGGILGGREWTAVGMQELYDTVRSTGARNIVYVSGISYAHDLRPAVSHPLDGYGIVYGAHVYCHDCQHLPPIVSRGVEPIIGVYPVAVTEFGTTLQDGLFNERVIAWAEGHGVGWQAFMWLPRGLGAYGLLESWDSYRPSPGGKPVLDALRRHSRR